MKKRRIEKTKKFIKDAEYKYNIGMNFMYKSPGLSIMELLSKEIILNITNFELLTSYRKHIRKYFSHPYLISLLEFPVLLGAAADKMPALYSLMAFSAFKQGTYYPIGGFHQVTQALIKICENLGVKFITNDAVSKINIENKKAVSINTNSGKSINTDFVIASADYAHVEKKLIATKFNNYSEEYWSEKKFFSFIFDLLFRP